MLTLRIKTPVEVPVDSYAFKNFVAEQVKNQVIKSWDSQIEILSIRDDEDGGKIVTVLVNFGY